MQALIQTNSIFKISGASLDKEVAESFSKFFERMKEKTVAECISMYILL